MGIDIFRISWHLGLTMPQIVQIGVGIFKL